MNARAKSFATMILVAMVAAGGFWLLREHWRHAAGILGYLPYLFFLACPLMHLFMHHGHRHGDHGHDLLQDARNDAGAGNNPAPRRSL